MSRYLKNLVMRSLREVSGLSPRPSNRYETVRQGGVRELTEAIQTTEGTEVSVKRRRSFQDASSRTVRPIMDAGPLEEGVQMGGQTDAQPQNDLGEESIETRRFIQRGISGERSEDRDVPKDERAVSARSPMDKGQVFRHSSAIPPVSAKSPAQAGDGTVGPAPQGEVASPERSGLRETEKEEQPESLPRTRTGADYPIDKEHQSSLARAHEGSSGPVRPTMGEVSFRRAHREEMAPSVRERAPVVQIRIGRIEVRAVEPPVPAPNKKLVESPRSSVSLDQYLRRRSQEA